MPIELKSVSYTYAPDTPYSVQALNNVSLTINEGEFVGVMGRTGCGKSTFIQIIGGLLIPDSGTVLFDNQNINSKKYDRSILRQNIGIVFQFPEYQLFETTVERDVAFALKHAKLNKAEIKERVKEALCTVGFDYDKIKDKSPLSFSGGEKRKIAVAGVLAAKPKYLILDEPIAGLDPYGRLSFLEMLDRLNKNGTAIIMISHNADILAEYTSRILLMENGQLVRDGKTNDILSDIDTLEKSGVSAGQVSSIAHMMRQNGAPVSTDIIKYHQLIEEICRIYGRDEL